MDVLTRVPVREQEPAVRATNFEEVCLGYNEEEAMAEENDWIATLILRPEKNPNNPSSLKIAVVVSKIL